MIFLGLVLPLNISQSFLSDISQSIPLSSPSNLPRDSGRCAPFNPKSGRYPTADEGVVNMTTCFGGDSEQTCGDYVAVGVISCEGFLLWRLPYAADCESGYCTVTASGF